MKKLWMMILCAGVALAALAAPRAPNVVMLLADDLGYGDLGCYGGPVKTPALDGLAAGGVRFTDFYSGCAVCSPSRATLLTGRNHIRAGVYNWINDEVHRTHLLEREITLAEVLKKEGYETAHVGKWHLGLPYGTFDKPTPAEHGFDYWFATDNNALPTHHNPTNFYRNGKALGKMEGYSCQLVVDEAIQWLEEHRDPAAPFFLNVWFHEPHMKVAAPAGIVEEYSRFKPAKKNARLDLATYSATIDNTDRAIARLLAKLREVAPPEQTLIIYGSDNGCYMPERTGGLRSKKGQNWEGGIRVPGIFCWPGIIQAGAVESAPAGLTDVLPTVCGLLGLEKPDVHLDGSDLTGLLTGKPKEFNRHQPLFWHLQKARPIVAIRDGDYSLLAEPDYELSRNNTLQEAWIPAIKTGGYTNYQLFNLKDDPAQENDLSTAQPERLERMKKKLLEINASVMADGPDWHLE
ncbi:Arylsulfatase [Pontiella desulfatans]|uniref:Arylsulfatase n=1 Tax=Pontiella desulfatans TaxID=2750659 RepID=A0A6C2TYB4_PONDE|nr:sulfatase-like hydrolase/transferase [Pontiella desulfatans]SPS73650.1 sulfatase S1_23 [Kiritimatiellales bacterium]VGO12341.1 Arylsulfatase [Pontiella desulfatans]